MSPFKVFWPKVLGSVQGLGICSIRFSSNSSSQLVPLKAAPAPDSQTCACLIWIKVWGPTKMTQLIGKTDKTLMHFSDEILLIYAD